MVISSELAETLNTLNISNLENGIYLIKIKTSDKVVDEQLIKK